MPRRKSPSDASKLKQGRGTGHGKDYVPFDKVREVPSVGLSHRSKSNTTGRVQEQLSTLEHNISCILDWAKLEVREQFPLPLDETMRIAERLSIKHPTNPKTKEPWIIRLDLLVTLNSESSIREFAITAKHANELESKRVIEKFEIERTYCTEHGIGWGITTEREVLNGLITNIKWVQRSGNIEDMPGLRSEDLDYYESALLQELEAYPTTILSHACINSDKKLGFKPGTSLWLVQHFICTRRWQIDMLEKIDTSKPFKIGRINKTAGNRNV